MIRTRFLIAAMLLVGGCAVRRPAPPAPPIAPPAAPVTLSVPTPVLAMPKVRPRPRPAPRPKPARPVPRRADPAAAAQARAAGLAALARGDATAALPLFRRAAALDPGDPLIRRDLARAQHAASRPR